MGPSGSASRPGHRHLRRTFAVHFRAFLSGSPLRSRRFPEWRAGMAIAQAIARAHYGAIGMHQQGGSWFNFTVILPLLRGVKFSY